MKKKRVKHSRRELSFSESDEAYSSMSYIFFTFACSAPLPSTYIIKYSLKDEEEKRKHLSSLLDHTGCLQLFYNGCSI
jgi:hypothetical protein